MEDITDQTLEDLIRRAPAWTYLEELKEYVAGQLDIPFPFTDKDPDKPHYGSPFAYRIYTINQAVEKDVEAARIKDLGFVKTDPDTLSGYEGQFVECLVGRGVMGDTIKTGRILAHPDGGYWFRPKGNRTKGYYPTYIRKVG